MNSGWSISPPIRFAVYLKLRQYYGTKRVLQQALDAHMEEFCAILEHHNLGSGANVAYKDLNILVIDHASKESKLLGNALSFDKMEEAKSLVSVILRNVGKPLDARAMLAACRLGNHELQSFLELLLEEMHLSGHLVAHYGVSYISYSLPKMPEVPDAA